MASNQSVITGLGYIPNGSACPPEFRGKRGHSGNPKSLDRLTHHTKSYMQEQRDLAAQIEKQMRAGGVEVAGVVLGVPEEWEKTKTRRGSRVGKKKC